METDSQEPEVEPGQLVVVEEETDTATASTSASTVPSSGTDHGMEVLDNRRRVQPTAQERKVEEKRALEKRLKG